MNIKELLPDFNAISKTDWSKPQLDTKDKGGIAMLIAAIVMVVAVFMTWTEYNITLYNRQTFSHSVTGISEWYGVFVLIFGLAAVVGVLYNHKSLVFTAAILGLIFGFILASHYPEAKIGGYYTVNSEATWKELVRQPNVKYHHISHTGKSAYMVASLVLAIISFRRIKKSANQE